MAKPFTVNSAVGGSVPPQKPYTDPAQIQASSIAFKQVFYHFNLTGGGPTSFNITDRTRPWYITKIKFDAQVFARANMRMLEYSTLTGSGSNRSTMLFMTYDPTYLPATSSTGVIIHEDINFNPPLLMDPRNGELAHQFAMTGWASESGNNSAYFSIFGFEGPD